MKKATVVCTQTVSYTYEVNVHPEADVKKYVYQNLRNCDDNYPEVNDYIHIGEYGDIEVDEILEEN